MKTTMTYMFLSLLISFAFSCVCLAEEIKENTLKNNPFIKPFEIYADKHADEDFVSNDEIILKATLISNVASESIANINGEMVVVGQKIYNYVLVNVGIGSAVLQANGKQKLLTINDNYKDIR